MPFHKTILECPERLLIEQYLKQEYWIWKHLHWLTSRDTCPAECIRCNSSKASLESAMSDEAIHGYISRNMAYCERVQEGLIDKTAQLGITYVDHIRLLLSLHWWNHSDKTVSSCVSIYSISWLIYSSATGDRIMPGILPTRMNSWPSSIIHTQLLAVC